MSQTAHQVAVVAMLFCISLFLHSRVMTKFERKSDEQLSKTYFHFTGKLSLVFAVVALMVAVVAKLFY